MYDRMTKTKNMYIVLAPAFFTSYLRDLYAFFICLDLLFMMPDTYYDFIDYYAYNNELGGEKYSHYFEKINSNEYFENISADDNARARAKLSNLREPKFDLTEQEYISLYDTMKHDFNIELQEKIKSLTSNQTRKATHRHRNTKLISNQQSKKLNVIKQSYKLANYYPKNVMV
jgi:hypothetical protein